MRFRRGSALLIVLGMMAFMVISAVAFSAYMRYSRLPSSYLRRSSASRLLVKAALAEAIDEIDAAIGNNPHPGIGSNGYTYDEDTNSRDSKGTTRNRNTWKNRIYIGSTSIGGGSAASGIKGQNASASTSVNGFVDPDETVSTLTLEGLAYIPPALVNDARYYSRRSLAGMWKSLAFDSGRYAFCAIDVSDYLNINALMADVARAGSADRRLSLAYLFEGGKDHASASGQKGSPSGWDAFMANFSGSGKVPLVSLADFNLALYDKKPGSLNSVFCDYVMNGKASYYGGITAESDDAELIRRQAFITDSYFPDNDEDGGSGANQPGKKGQQGGSSSNAPDHLDLDEEDNQPFTKGELRSTRTLIQIADENLANANAFAKFEQCINALGFCQLYDYLDNNDDPLSLAIPTVERVPMICGLSPEMQSGALTVAPSVIQNNVIAPVNGGAPAIGAQYTITLQVKYEIQGLPTAPLNALVVYPFRHEAKNNNTYELGGRMAYFLSMDGKDVGLRTKTTSDVLHIGHAPNVTPSQPIDNAVYAVEFSPETVSPSSFNGGANGPQGAVKKIKLTPKGIVPNSITFLEVTYVDKGTYVANPVQGALPAVIPDPNHDKVDITSQNFAISGTPTCNWQPLDGNGKVAADFGTALMSTLANPQYKNKFKLNLAVWAWVKNKSTNRIVDMVPACVYDDGDLNSRNTDSRSKNWGQQHLGGAYPLMRFDMANGGSPVMEFDASQLQAALTASGGGQLAVTPESVMVCDPRFNHAPESWFQMSGQLNENTWLSNCDCGWQTAGSVRRDGDIFMSVSDNEELQSIYELANLMRFTDFYRNGTTYGSKNLGYSPPDNKNYTSFPANAADTANFGYMWRTYDPFGRYQDGGDDFEGPEVHASCEGYKLTPYSTQTNVMMAAFANTPHEWALSSANDQTMNSIPDTAQGFNAKYAWNAYSSGAKIDWYDLEDLCGSFLYDMQLPANINRMANGSMTWEDVWADLDWVDFSKSGDDQSKYLLSSLQLSNTSNQGRIYNCDRKFLYGFWHDCFDLKQQLFLVFVRAEPTMMGGGAVGQTPPQLGARAVALVWRDPTASSENNGPHQTRVLFYRQFD